MPYQDERDNFVALMHKADVRAEAVRKLLALSTTHGRLAVAQCNGDWPADNVNRHVIQCDTCGRSWVPSSFRRVRGYQAACYKCDWRGPECRKLAAAYTSAAEHTEHAASEVHCLGECPDCNIERRIRELAEREGFHVEFQGDPRGYTVKVIVNGRETGVPQRN